MAGRSLETIKEKAEKLDDLKYKFESLVQRAEENKKKGINISLPEFDAFGWERLEEFIGRFEDAINTPLLEECRKILEGNEIVLDQQILDKLKSGLSVRKEGLIEIFREMSKDLKKIKITELKLYVKKELAIYLSEGRWDGLITIVDEWQKLERTITPIKKGMNEKTLLYNAIFDKALEEGPSTQVIENLMDIENRAYQIGGEHLKELIKLEKPRSQINPLNNVDEDVGNIVKKKEDIRIIKGEDVDLDEFIETDDTLSIIVKTLEKKYREIDKVFKDELIKTENLLRKYNNLAVLLKKGSRSKPAEPNLKQLREVIDEISIEIERLETELLGSFTKDAREFIDNLIDGRLPGGWESKRIVQALHEIINSGYSFDIKRVE